MTQPTIEDLQDTYPVFSTILVSYFAAHPGASKGTKGDDATLATRFAATGGEDNPEFTGLYAELTTLARTPSHAATLINHAYGLTPTDPRHVDRPTARTLVTDLTTTLYDDTPTPHTDDDDGGQAGPTGWADVRAQAFDTYRSHVLLHLPDRTPGHLPAVHVGPINLPSRPLAGMPVTTTVAVIVGLLVVALGMAILLPLRAVGAPTSVVAPAAFPFLLAGGALTLWSITTMLLVRSAIVHPVDEDGDGVDDRTEKEQSKAKARARTLKALRSR